MQMSLTGLASKLTCRRLVFSQRQNASRKWRIFGNLRILLSFIAMKPSGFLKFFNYHQRLELT